MMPKERQHSNQYIPARVQHFFPARATRGGWKANPMALALVMQVTMTTKLAIQQSSAEPVNRRKYTRLYASARESTIG